MADSLLFRKGLLANLPSTKTAGTIYVTTDERAMYIDVDGTNRIRLGDFIEVATQDDLKNYKPFSTTALYYITSTDALMKYKGVVDGAETFVTINSTAAVSAQIAEVKALAEGNAADISELQENLSATNTANSNTQKEVDALEIVVANNKSAIEKTVSDLDAAYKAADTTLTASINTNTQDIAELQENKADKSTVTALDTAYKAADTALTNSLNSVSGRVTTLENTINNTTTGLSAKVTTLENNVTTINNTITDMQEDHSELAGRVTTNEGEIGTLKTKVNTNTSEISTIKSNATELTKRVAANETDIGDLKTTIGTHTSDISGLQETIATKADKSTVTALDTAYKAADTTLTNNLNAAIGRISANEGKITNLETADTQINGRIDTNAQEITSLQENKADKSTVTALDTAYKAADTALNKKITDLTARVSTNETDIGDLKTRMGSAESGISTNTTAIEELEEDLTTNYVKLSTYNTKMTALDNADSKHTKDISDLVTKTNTTNTNLSNLQTRVGTAESNIDTNIANIADNASAIAENAEAIAALQQADIDLETYINEKFRTADAMKFMGSVSAYSQLTSKTDVEAGHTYVLTADDSTMSASAGDFYIAETDGDNKKWIHVKSGYQAAHQPSLSADNGEIVLLSASNSSLGAISVEADVSTSATVEVSDNTITVGMVWGSF